MLTTAGMIPEIAGLKNALAAPAIAASAAIAQTPGSPAISSAAIRPWAAKRMRSVVTISARRGSRSAHTPPTSRNATSGIVRAASTMPRSLAEPVCSSTAKASATPTMPSPSSETAWPRNSSRNGRSVSASKRPATQSTAVTTASATSARGVSDAS